MNDINWLQNTWQIQAYKLNYTENTYYHPIHNWIKDG